MCLLQFIVEKWRFLVCLLRFGFPFFMHFQGVQFLIFYRLLPNHPEQKTLNREGPQGVESKGQANFPDGFQAESTK
jgi:hypothetical protein